MHVLKGRWKTHTVIPLADHLAAKTAETTTFTDSAQEELQTKWSTERVAKLPAGKVASVDGLGNPIHNFIDPERAIFDAAARGRKEDFFNDEYNTYHNWHVGEKFYWVLPDKSNRIAFGEIVEKSYRGEPGDNIAPRTKSFYEDVAKIKPRTKIFTEGVPRQEQENGGWDDVNVAHKDLGTGEYYVMFMAEDTWRGYGSLEEWKDVGYDLPELQSMNFYSDIWEHDTKSAAEKMLTRDADATDPDMNQGDWVWEGKKVKLHGSELMRLGCGSPTNLRDLYERAVGRQMALKRGMVVTPYTFRKNDDVFWLKDTPNNYFTLEAIMSLKRVKLIEPVTIEKKGTTTKGWTVVRSYKAPSYKAFEKGPEEYPTQVDVPINELSRITCDTVEDLVHKSIGAIGVRLNRRAIGIRNLEAGLSPWDHGILPWGAPAKEYGAINPITPEQTRRQEIQHDARRAEIRKVKVVEVKKTEKLRKANLERRLTAKKMFPNQEAIDRRMADEDKAKFVDQKNAEEQAAYHAAKAREDYDKDFVKRGNENAIKVREHEARDKAAQKEERAILKSDGIFDAQYQRRVRGVGQERARQTQANAEEDAAWVKLQSTQETARVQSEKDEQKRIARDKDMEWLYKEGMKMNAHWEEGDSFYMERDDTKYTGRIKEDLGGYPAVYSVQWDEKYNGDDDELWQMVHDDKCVVTLMHKDNDESWAAWYKVAAKYKDNLNMNVLHERDVHEEQIQKKQEVQQRRKELEIQDKQDEEERAKEEQDERNRRSALFGT